MSTALSSGRGIAIANGTRSGSRTTGRVTGRYSCAAPRAEARRRGGQQAPTPTVRGPQAGLRAKIVTYCRYRVGLRPLSMVVTLN